MLLYIIRHADPIYNPDTLTPKGKLQAQALAKRLAVHGLDRIYSSPSGRAMETAQPTAELLGLDINIEEWTREIDDRFSVVMHDGKKIFAVNVENSIYRSAENMDLGSRWYDAEIFESIDAKGEYDKLCACSDDFLARLGYVRDGGVYRIERASEERVAVFCHGGLSQVWLSHLLNIPVHMFMAGIGISHTGVTILDFENRSNGITAPYCLCLSDISHIYKENLPLKFTNSIEI